MGRIKKRKDYYVYVYLDPRKPGKFIYREKKIKLEFDYEPFYIGEGRKARCFVHIYRLSDKNPFYSKGFKSLKIKKIIRETGQKPIIQKIFKDISKEKALNIENKVIKMIGRRDLKKGPLTNLTDGGKMSYTQKNYNNSNPILQFNLKGKFIKEYESKTEASDKLGFEYIFVNNEINENCETSYDYIWIYKSFFVKQNLEEPKTLPEYILIFFDFKRTSISLVQFSKDGYFIKEWKSFAEVYKVLKIMHGQMRVSCEAKGNNAAGNFIWRYRHDFGETIPYKINGVIKQNKKLLKVKIAQFSETGDLIKIFDSTYEARKIFKNNIMKTTLLKHLKAKGFYWRRVDEFKNGIVPKKIKVPIIKKIWQISLNGEKIKLWTSIEEASMSLKIQSASIRYVCEKKKYYKTAKGFLWEYEKL